MRTSLEVADIFRTLGPTYRAVHAGHLPRPKFGRGNGQADANRLRRPALSRNADQKISQLARRPCLAEEVALNFCAAFIP